MRNSSTYRGAKPLDFLTIGKYSIFVILVGVAVGRLMAKQANYKKPNSDVLKKQLTDVQYKVTQKNGTEAPFQNEYWDHKEEGIYVDVVTGEPLFSSKHKFDSGSGWPSFYKTLTNQNVLSKVDTSHGMERTEVRSKEGDSHLGHVFNDGPTPTGLRYCINSASLKFIPKSKLKEMGYEEFLKDFE